jgi:hypothetical protein
MILPKFLRPRTPLELASRELDEAKRELLEAQTGQDYAKRMVEYHSDRVKRLTAYVANESKGE